ncbi:hypothetical protein [Lichenicoccus sp.]|uniref:hypothetical protein n=1 Tax=Lichenicoccus sp. TaxID=2781899 RepID=UPI003D0CF4F7
MLDETGKLTVSLSSTTASGLLIDARRMDLVAFADGRRAFLLKGVEGTAIGGDAYSAQRQPGIRRAFAHNSGGSAWAPSVAALLRTDNA